MTVPFEFICKFAHLFAFGSVIFVTLIFEQLFIGFASLFVYDNKANLSFIRVICVLKNYIWHQTNKFR